MKFKMLEQGNDGFRHLNPGDEIEQPSAWLVRCLQQGGVVEPVDDEAKAFADKYTAKSEG